ncbi:hypothetical protein Bhyg_04461, partial [Pseudolycoriella hygida]
CKYFKSRRIGAKKIRNCDGVFLRLHFLTQFIAKACKYFKSRRIGAKKIRNCDGVFLRLHFLTQFIAKG